jgi:hypothetical protein
LTETASACTVGLHRESTGFDFRNSNTTGVADLRQSNTTGAADYASQVGAPLVGAIGSAR